MQRLDLDVVEDIALAHELRRTPIPELLRDVYVDCDLGALAELVAFANTWAVDILHDPFIQQSDIGRCLGKAMHSVVPIVAKTSKMHVGFMRLTQTNVQDVETFVQFGYPAQVAAREAGVPLAAAQSLVGAIQELRDNIVEHSGAVSTGLLGFLAIAGRFDFVVLDSGIGVLKSLRQHKDYAHLENAGVAIKTAIRDGESRHGRKSGHGLGFAELFRGLAKVRGLLRLRSDDYAATLDSKLEARDQARLAPTATAAGLLVSVSCIGQ